MIEPVIVKEAPKPVPVIVKTIHDKVVVTEDPTDIHHVTLEKKQSVVRAAPPPPVVKVQQIEEAKAGWFKWWYLLALCCLPLCCLPFLLCKPKKKYVPGPVSKVQRAGTIAQKNIYGKEAPEFKVEKINEMKIKKKAIVRKIEEPQEDIEIEIERELEKKAIVEETIVVRKEIPLAEYES